MSETAEAPVPEVETPAAAAPEAPQTPAPEVAAPETPDAPEASGDTPAAGDEPWRKVRIEQMARQKNDAVRERDLARRELEETRALIAELQAGRDPDRAKADAARIETEARRLAAAELAARDMDTKLGTFLDVGRKAFSDFDQRCQVVADLGAGPKDRPEFMATIGDMGEDGPRVVMHLADNPAEVQRILSLPPHSMALALSRVEQQTRPKPAAPKPISQAPKPVTPVSGATVNTGDIFDPNLSMAEYSRLRERQIKDRDARR